MLSAPRLLATAIAAAALSAAMPARAQWNVEKQEELERQRAKAQQQEVERRARDPEDLRINIARTTSVDIGELGLRGGAVESRNGDRAPGFALAIAGSTYFDGAVNRRVTVWAHVGESDGIEGSARADAALGYRFDLDPWYGFVVRGGVRGRIYGNDRLALSMLEAPQAQVGFQLLRTISTPTSAQADGHGKADESPLGPIHLLELAGRASAGLAARAEVDTRERHLKPTPAFGGHFVVVAWMLALNVEYARFLPNGASTEPIEDAAAHLCARGELLSICANGEATWASVRGPANDERRERVLMYGATMSVGLGQLLPRGGW